MKILMMDSNEDIGKAASDELSARQKKSETHQYCSQ